MRCEPTTLRATGSRANGPVNSQPTMRRAVSQATKSICPLTVPTSATVRSAPASTMRTPSARHAPIASLLPSGEKLHAPELRPSGTRAPGNAFSVRASSRASSASTVGRSCNTASTGRSAAPAAPPAASARRPIATSLFMRLLHRTRAGGSRLASALVLDPKVFKAYDVRGLYGSEIDEEGAYAIGHAYVEQFRPQRIAVGRDMRVSSPAMAAAVIEGAADAGADVVDIGLVGTEIVYFAVGAGGLDGGIAVT